MSDPISLLGSLIWDAWGGKPEEADQARELGASLVASLQGMGYRVVKQEQVWYADMDGRLMVEPGQDDDVILLVDGAWVDRP